MINPKEISEREERAVRLRFARERAGLGGPGKLQQRFGWNQNNYKAHEQGRNGFSPVDAKKYAKAFSVSLPWLMFGTGTIDDIDVEHPAAIEIPLISWVSAGMFGTSDGITGVEDFPTVTVSGLPDGDWYALDVIGDSMDRISPPASRIFVNARDKKLVNNACFIVLDGEGGATYKRYRQSPDRFEPVSTNPVHEPIFPDQGNTPPIFGRVGLSTLRL